MSRATPAYWSLLAASILVYMLMVLWTLPGISADAGGLAPFDLRPFGYSADEAREFLAALGETGLRLYSGPQRLLDLAYPLLLALVLALTSRLLMPRSRLRTGLIAVIVLGMTADYAENLAVAGMLASPAPVSADQVRLASGCTQAKSLFTGVAMGVIVLAALRRFLIRYRRT